MKMSASNDENLERDKYIILIFCLLQMQEEQTKRLWQELDKELRGKNRYFPKNELCKKLESLAPLSKTVLHKGDIIYRSRKVPRQREESLISGHLSRIAELFHKYIPDAEMNDGLANQLQIMGYFNTHHKEHKSFLKEFRPLLRELNQKDFLGYNEEDSDAPSHQSGRAGRTNPSGISYLYACYDPLTAILEVRPIPTQFVSLAEIKITQNCTLFDFSKSPAISGDGLNDLDMVDYSVISRQFSMPNFGEDADYYITQYISEFIKNINTDTGERTFDGLCFKSSLNPDGVNIVLFDTSASKKYKVRNSKLVQVRDLLGNTEQILPLSDEDINNIIQGYTG